MFTRPRSSWQSPAQPVSGPRLPPITQYTQVAIHYTAAARIPADIDAYHRAMQADYLRSRGFSLGYTCSVDMGGVSREIRGLDFKPAATRTANDYALAILILVNGDGMASPAACAEVRRLVGEFERRAGRVLRIRPHSEFVPTGCPGSGLRAQIVLGEFSPRWNPVTEEDDMGIIITNAEPFFGGPPRQAKFLLLESGKLRYLASELEWQARGSKDGIPWTNAQISAAGVVS